MKKETKVTRKDEDKEKEENKPQKLLMRQIIIETDGNNINITKADVNGKIELVGILQTVIAFINQQK